MAKNSSQQKKLLVKGTEFDVARPIRPEVTGEKRMVNYADTTGTEKIHFQNEFYKNTECYFSQNWDKFFVWHDCSNKLIIFEQNQKDEYNFYTLGKEVDISNYGFICPHCEKPLLSGEHMSGNKYSNYSFTIRKFVGVDINDYKINIGIVDVVYTLWPQKILEDAYFTVECFSIRYCLNIKTGYSYELNKIKFINQGKGLNKNSKRGLKNISYYGSDLELPVNALDCIYTKINERMKILHGEKVPSFSSYNIELSFSNLIFYIRNPYICPVQYNGLITKSRREHKGNTVDKRMLIKNDCENPISQLFLQNKVPNVKSIRKIAFSNLKGFPLLSSITHSFKNVDLICAIYTAYLDCQDYMERYVDFSASIFKRMIKGQGEKAIAIKLISFKKHDKHNNALQTLRDIIRCYEELELCEFDFKKSYGIDDLHLNLASSLAKQDNENKEIPYSEDEKAFEMSNGIFSLTLAKDTYELIDVGEAMKICVGSYGRQALEKSCSILVLRHNANFNFPVACVELRGKSIMQAKAPHNHLLRDEKKQFIMDWAKKNNLIIKTKDLNNNFPAIARAADDYIWNDELPF